MPDGGARKVAHVSDDSYFPAQGGQELIGGSARRCRGRLVPGGPSWWQPSLTIISVLVWVAFVIDYTVRLALSRHRWQFIRAHPLGLQC